MDSYPTQLAMRSADELAITWSGGATRVYTVRELREHCPCATCREKRAAPAPPPSLLPVLSAAEARPLRLAEMNPVGSYAYNIRFSDGHDTGIYTFETLRELGREEPQ